MFINDLLGAGSASEARDGRSKLAGDVKATGDRAETAEETGQQTGSGGARRVGALGNDLHVLDGSDCGKGSGGSTLR